MANVTRKNFLAAAAVSAGLLGLAGCDTTTTDGEKDTAPAADTYPIDPDGEDVEAKWASEETRDGWTRITQEGGAELGVMDTAKIIQVDGYAFKDLNGNGKLDLYEDWRQNDEDRAKALADMMSAEEILPLMFTRSTRIPPPSSARACAPASPAPTPTRTTLPVPLRGSTPFRSGARPTTSTASRT